MFRIQIVIFLSNISRIRSCLRRPLLLAIGLENLRPTHTSNPDYFNILKSQTIHILFPASLHNFNHILKMFLSYENRLQEMSEDHSYEHDFSGGYCAPCIYDRQYKDTHAGTEEYVSNVHEFYFNFYRNFHEEKLAENYDDFPVGSDCTRSLVDWKSDEDKCFYDATTRNGLIGKYIGECGEQYQTIFFIFQFILQFIFELKFLEPFLFSLLYFLIFIMLINKANIFLLIDKTIIAIYLQKISNFWPFKELVIAPFHLWYLNYNL